MLILFLNREVVLIPQEALEKFVLFCLITSIQTSHQINQTSNQKENIKIPEVGNQVQCVYKISPGALMCRKVWQPPINIFKHWLHELVKYGGDWTKINNIRF